MCTTLFMTYAKKFLMKFQNLIALLYIIIVMISIQYSVLHINVVYSWCIQFKSHCGGCGYFMVGMTVGVAPAASSSLHRLVMVFI